MKSIAINGSVRENLGKKEANQLRSEGKIPCVLYGDGEILHFYASEKEFKDLVYTPEVQSVSLNLGGKEYSAVMQEVQFHPVKDNILHIDFLALSKNKEVKVDVPVKLTGSAAGVRAGGKLIRKQRLLKVRSLPENLPDFIEVNVENLEVGGIIRARQVAAKNVAILNSPDTVIATVKGKRVEAATPAAADAKGAAPAAAGTAATPAKAAPAKK